ncbi:MAG: hypothetical protein HOB51_04420 [Thaumarchaeota archaeon]|nr:hypothetical protein [Nitrososphaerota archaeon]
MTTIERIIPRPERKSKLGKPVIINWKSVPMLRSQSINACVNDIYESSKSMGFIKINLIGASSSGKSTLAEVLCHQLHERDPTFEVHHLEDKDLIDFRTTIQNLSKNNQILAFDDLSGLVAKFGKTALAKLEAEITTIRHINQNEDRKIVMLLSFHAQKKLSKFLRISNFTFYTDCQKEEIGYLEELLGKNQKSKILQFANLRSQSRINHRFSFQLSRGNHFTYQDGKPFRVLLYNNGISTRFVVSPQLSWILDGEVCQKCYPSKKTEETKINLEKFRDDFSKKFGKGIAKRAIELKLLRQGFYTQPKRVMQAEKYIEQFFAAKKINLEELAELYGLKERTTKLFPDKKPLLVENTQ